MRIELQTAVCISLTLSGCIHSGEKQSLPNIVLILADDLGYGDLSCYGQKMFSTPNIDGLARKGMLFTQHYAGSTVSAPSRSCLMTGYHTGHTPIRGNKEWMPEGQWPLPASAFTIAELLEERGYTSGVYGKWGLGFTGTEGDPNSQGFDEFYGYNCQRLAHNYYPEHLWHNRQRILLTENDSGKSGLYGPDAIHKAALNFLEVNRAHPFFLYYPSIIPHAELIAKEDYIDRFRGMFDPEKTFSGVDDGPAFRKGPYGSQPEAHAAFAALVMELDDYVGEILQKLKDLGLDKNTVVIFTSDNGPHLEGGADPVFFNSSGGLRGFKRDLYEGGIRTPLLVSWPGHIQAGSVSDHISAFWDIMPTLAEIAGLRPPPELDGISFLPALLGKHQKQHEYLYWEFHEAGGKIAMRMDNWKALRLNIDSSGQGPLELYDLSSDRDESENLAASQPEVARQMDNLLMQAHTPSSVFPFAGENNKEQSDQPSRNDPN